MINTNYGKLIDNYPRYLLLPVHLTEDITINGVVHSAGSWVSTDDEEAIIELGYKPIIRTERRAEAGFYYTEKWEESDTAITQVWEEHEQPITLEEELNAAYQEGVNDA